MKLTDQQVDEIQWLFYIGVKASNIAREYKVTRGTITYYTKALPKLSPGQVVQQFMPEHQREAA